MEWLYFSIQVLIIGLWMIFKGTSIKDDVLF